MEDKDSRGDEKTKKATSAIGLSDKPIDRFGVDTDSLRKHQSELSEYELNGREIRNAITTARQLAMYKQKKMDFWDVKHVIGVAGKFNKYLLGVNEGTTDAQIMREDHVR